MHTATAAPVIAQGATALCRLAGRGGGACMHHMRRMRAGAASHMERAANHEHSPCRMPHAACRCLPAGSIAFRSAAPSWPCASSCWRNLTLSLRPANDSRGHMACAFTATPGRASSGGRSCPSASGSIYQGLGKDAATGAWAWAGGGVMRRQLRPARPAHLAPPHNWRGLA